MTDERRTTPTSAVAASPGKRAVRLALLRAVGAATAPLVPKATRTPPARVLVIRPDHLGDALFTTPALRALREALPGAEIIALVGPWATAVYGRNPNLDRVLPCRFPGFAEQPQPHALAPYTLLRCTAAEVRHLDCDVALDLRYDFWWGALLAQAARIPVRIGYAVPECAPFLSLALPYERGRHEVAQNLGLVAALAAGDGAGRQRWLAEVVTRARLEFPLTDGERQAATAFLAEVGGRGRPIVAIHPGTRGLAKLWTVAGWAGVADALSARLGATVLLTGSTAEDTLCTQIAAQMHKRAFVLAGRTTLGELAALFARCTLVLGVDSGPLHFAAAAGVPTVHLYGPSDHVAFAPFGDPARHAVVRAGLACSPCHKLDWPSQVMPEHDCMRAIAPADVLAAAERVLAGVNASDRDERAW